MTPVALERVRSEAFAYPQLCVILWMAECADSGCCRLEDPPIESNSAANGRVNDQRIFQLDNRWNDVHPNERGGNVSDPKESTKTQGALQKFVLTCYNLQELASNILIFDNILARCCFM